MHVTCTRHEDGDYCPVKALHELFELVHLRFTCNLGACSPVSTCQASYRAIRSRLGCCGRTYFDNPLNPFFTEYGKFFANCNASLRAAPCEPASLSTSAEEVPTSGVAVLCMNVLLFSAASILVFLVL